jgi:hypothetical protein
MNGRQWMADGKKKKKKTKQNKKIPTAKKPLNFKLKNTDMK